MALDGIHLDMRHAEGDGVYYGFVVWNSSKSIHNHHGIRLVFKLEKIREVDPRYNRFVCSAGNWGTPTMEEATEAARWAVQQLSNAYPNDIETTSLITIE